MPKRASENLNLELFPKILPPMNEARARVWRIGVAVAHMTEYRTGTGWTSLTPRVHRHGAHGGGIAAHGDGAVVLAEGWSRACGARMQNCPSQYGIVFLSFCHYLSPNSKVAVAVVTKGKYRGGRAAKNAFNFK